MARCELCARVLQGGKHAPYITELLLSESQNAVCRSCRALTSGDGKPARALHIVNELVTPEVNYGTWAEFAQLVYQVQDEYCACVDRAVREAILEQSKKSIVLGTACMVHGTFLPMDLSFLRVHGADIILRLTKDQGRFWCQMVAHLVYTRALRAAAIYNDLVSSTVAEYDFDCVAHVHSMIKVMQDEVRHTFSGAMPFSIYTLCSGFVSTLLVKNFTFYDNHDLTAFTDAQFRALLLSLCMGLHPRLGKRSPLHPLHDELLQHICSRLPASQLAKHLVFHTQEQWLVA